MRLNNTITVYYTQFSRVANRLARKNLPCEFFRFLFRDILMVNPYYNFKILLYDELEVIGNR